MHAIAYGDAKRFYVKHLIISCVPQTRVIKTVQLPKFVMRSC